KEAAFKVLSKSRRIQSFRPSTLEVTIDSGGRTGSVRCMPHSSGCRSDAYIVWIPFKEGVHAVACNVREELCKIHSAVRTLPEGENPSYASVKLVSELFLRCDGVPEPVVSLAPSQSRSSEGRYCAAAIHPCH